MKILFVWRKIDGVAGGVERMSAAIMNEMIARGHDVSFLTWDHDGASSYYPLDKNITWYKLGIGDPTKKGDWKTRFKRMGKVRKIVRQDKPDLIFCFESGVFFSIKMFLTGFRIPMIAAERNAPSRHTYSSRPHNRYVVFAMLALADKITVQFDRYKESYPFFLRNKMVAIHNPVAQTSIAATPEGKTGQKKILLCVSRLAYQKNIHALYDAFIKIEKECPEWILRLAGDGEEEEYFKQKVITLNLQDKIEFLGAVSDVSPLYASSHLFCLPSRYEGFPNALAEALSHGLPAVGYAGCCGVSDLIQHNATGLLAEGNGNVETLSRALAVLMKEDETRKNMGAAAKNSMKKFDPKTIFDQWEDFFKGLA